MTRRQRTRPVDYVRDRKRWTGLIEAARAVIAAPPVGANETLARAAMQARTSWNPPFPYPTNLSCAAFTGLLLYFARESHPERRREIAPALRSAADLLDRLIATAELARTTATPRKGGWLPYADD
jgi:hypothetical protein